MRSVYCSKPSSAWLTSLPPTWVLETPSFRLSDISGTERAVIDLLFSNLRVSHLGHWADRNQVRSIAVADFLGFTRGIFSAELANRSSPRNIPLETGAEWVFSSDSHKPDRLTADR